MRNFMQAIGQKFCSWLGVGCLLFLLFGCQRVEVPTGLSVTVSAITAQQELAIAGVEGHPEITESLRLAGVAIPTSQPWGEAAESQLSQLTQKPVLIETDGAERNDLGSRSVYAWVDGILLNEALIAQGNALVVPKFSPKYDRRLSRAQDRARILGLGIWNPQNPLRWNPVQNSSDRPL
jgi:micrococcal nuclease